MGYFISKEYVPELKRKLWHVYKGSTLIDAFEEKCTAETYCKFLKYEKTNSK